MKYMSGDYVDVETGETINFPLFKRLSKTNDIKILRKFKQKLKNGQETRVYTTIEYQNRGKLWSGELFSSEN